MSVIEEPPQERHPVITYVTEAKESIIQDEIERELGRGGQVFLQYIIGLSVLKKWQV